MARRRRTRKAKKVSIPAKWRRDAIKAARMMQKSKKRRRPCKVYRVCGRDRELCRDRRGRFISNRPA